MVLNPFLIWDYREQQLYSGKQGKSYFKLFSASLFSILHHLHYKSMSQPTYFQKILFGSPGTGKSHTVDTKILKELGIDKTVNPENVIKTVFHPEYTYGDFMGKLLPLTVEKAVQYRYYEGHFLKALAQAYKNIKNQPEKPLNVVLIIDEINRGNSSAIFGGIFQLLDREDDGSSSYGINLSDMEHNRLLELIFPPTDRQTLKDGKVNGSDKIKRR